MNLSPPPSEWIPLDADLGVRHGMGHIVAELDDDDDDEDKESCLAAAMTLHTPEPLTRVDARRAIGHDA